MTVPNERLRRRDLAKWPHMLVRATWELAQARLALKEFNAKDVRELNSAALTNTARKKRSEQEKVIVARIGFVVTFVARYLPWRSDCLPQAIAAQRWLLKRGIGSEIRVGVERPDDGEFGAHAWLVHEEMIVTGGDVTHFSVILGEGSDGP
ncbi:MAG: lasso peptide biosynthesis B2 protein [Erythrobacter sp.]|nr:lasso peptide biosynthesis B2 protein [Erythrobacter sp.]